MFESRLIEYALEVMASVLKTATLLNVFAAKLMLLPSAHMVAAERMDTFESDLFDMLILVLSVVMLRVEMLFRLLRF